MLQLAIVAPCYNEEEILQASAVQLNNLFDSLIEKGKITPNSFVLLVNDGSRDNTWEIIRQLHLANKRFKGLCLAHNVGHQHAIMAGMMQAKDISDAVITIDVDLQDDLNCIEQMLDAYEEGYDIVYGVKVSRKADPVMKRM